MLRICNGTVPYKGRVRQRANTNLIISRRQMLEITKQSHLAILNIILSEFWQLKKILLTIIIKINIYNTLHSTCFHKPSIIIPPWFILLNIIILQKNNYSKISKLIISETYLLRINIDIEITIQVILKLICISIPEQQFIPDKTMFSLFK